MGKPRDREEDNHEKKELRWCGTRDIAEKPGADARDKREHEGDIDAECGDQTDPEEGVHVPLHGASHDGQNRQCEGVGDQGPTHHRDHGRILNDSQTTRHGVGEQGVRADNGTDQQGGRQTESRQGHHRHAKHHGDPERQHTEGDASGPILVEAVEIQFESRQKNQVEQPDLAQKHEGEIPRQKVQHVGPDHRSEKDESDQPRNSKPLEEDRPEEEDPHGHREDQNGIGDGEVEGHHDRGGESARALAR